MKYTGRYQNDVNVQGYRRPQPGGGRGGRVLARAGGLARARQSAHDDAPAGGRRRPGARVRSHCRFRYRGTEYVSESGIKWMSGRTKPECGRALWPPRAAPLSPPTAGQRRPSQAGRRPRDARPCACAGWWLLARAGGRSPRHRPRQPARLRGKATPTNRAPMPEGVSAYFTPLARLAWLHYHVALPLIYRYNGCTKRFGTYGIRLRELPFVFEASLG